MKSVIYSIVEKVVERTSGTVCMCVAKEFKSE